MVDGVKPAVQARARRTRARLLEALEELLREKDFEQIAVSDIAARAGVSVGSVYSHFADKEAFLVALLDESRARIEERFAIASAKNLEAEVKTLGGLRDALLAISQSGLQQVQTDAHITRATYTYSRFKPDFPWDEWEGLRERAYQRVKAVVDAYKDEIARKDRAKTARVLQYFLNVIFLDRSLFGERSIIGSAALTDNELVREVADMAYGYLTTPDAPELSPRPQKSD